MSRYEIRCKMCGEVHYLELDDNKVEQWKNGALAQKVFSDLSPDDRELIISGICGKCYDNMFKEDDE